MEKEDHDVKAFLLVLQLTLEARNQVRVDECPPRRVMGRVRDSGKITPATHALVRSHIHSLTRFTR